MIVRLKELHKIHFTINFRFQFYDSPIKRKLSFKIYVNDKCFNSMIVRLKARCPASIPAHWGCFNSMIVRLKGRMRLSPLRASAVSIL